MLAARNIEGVLFAVALATALVACGSVTAVQDGGAAHGGSAGAAGSAGGAAGSAGGAAGTAGGTAGAGGGGGRDAGDAEADAPHDTGGNPCHGLTEVQCGANSMCAAGTCGGCNGGPSYSGCYQTSTEHAPPCPGFVCPAPCVGLAEAACLARTDCRTDYCPSCQSKTFARCAAPSDGAPACPPAACPLPCAQVTTLDACEARPDCHSVFQDPGTCGCAGSGCCAHFSRCADGDKAACTGTPLCKIATPFCESPYVVAYTGSCYEGCVQKKDCAP